MVDQNLNALPQPSNLGSDEGNVWLCAQYCYHAEVQADRGSQSGANDQLTRAQRYLANVVDATAHDTGLSYYNAAVAYVQKAAGLDQAALQTATAVADGNVQQANAITPDQQAALDADNESWAAARNAQAQGGSADLAYVESKVTTEVKGAATTAANDIERGLAPLTSSLKAVGFGVGAVLGLVLVVVLVVKLA